MFVWRNAVILGLIFVIVGVIYGFVQLTPQNIDLAGATFLVILGMAMAFTFAVLLRGSREL